MHKTLSSEAENSEAEQDGRLSKTHAQWKPAYYTIHCLLLNYSWNLLFFKQNIRFILSSVLEMSRLPFTRINLSSLVLKVGRGWSLSLELDLDSWNLIQLWEAATRQLGLEPATHFLSTLQEIRKEKL